MMKLPDPKKVYFEVYTLSETVRVEARSLKDAIDIIDCDIHHDPVIGAIAVDLFHKGATQRPDLL